MLGGASPPYINHRMFKSFVETKTINSAKTKKQLNEKHKLAKTFFF
jgi:hypothetical protein